MRLPSLALDPVVEVVLPSLSALLRRLKKLALGLEEDFLRNLVPVVVLNMTTNLYNKYV